MKDQARIALAGDLLLTALAPVIWGTTYIVTSEFLPPGRPFTAAALRCLPAGLLLLLACRQLPPRSQWPRLLWLSLLNIGAFQALLFVAAYRLPGGLAAVLGACQPLLVLGLAWGVDGRRPSPWIGAAAALGVVGMAGLFVSPSSQWDGLGVAAALAGAACMATGTYLTRRHPPAMPVAVLTGMQLLLGGLMLAPLAWAVEGPLQALDRKQLLGFAYLCIVGAVVSYALWFRGVRRLPSVASASLGLLSPVTAVALGWIFLGQAVRGVAWLGLGGVLLSVLFVQWQAASAAPMRAPRRASATVPRPAPR